MIELPLPHRFTRTIEAVDLGALGFPGIGSQGSYDHDCDQIAARKSHCCRHIHGDQTVVFYVSDEATRHLSGLVAVVAQTVGLNAAQITHPAGHREGQKGIGPVASRSNGGGKVHHTPVLVRFVGPHFQETAFGVENTDLPDVVAVRSGSDGSVAVIAIIGGRYALCFYGVVGAPLAIFPDGLRNERLMEE